MQQDTPKRRLFAPYRWMIASAALLFMLLVTAAVLFEKVPKLNLSVRAFWCRHTDQYCSAVMPVLVWVDVNREINVSAPVRVAGEKVYLGLRDLSPVDDARYEGLKERLLQSGAQIVDRLESADIDVKLAFGSGLEGHELRGFGHSTCLVAIAISRLDHNVDRVTAVRKKPKYILMRTVYFEYFASFVSEEIAIRYATDAFMDGLAEPLTRDRHVHYPSVHFESTLRIER